MNGNRNNRDLGFSLIEVMIAMTILSVGVLGFIGLYGTGFKALRSGSIRTTAVRLAQDQMEVLRLRRPGPTPTPDPTDTPEAGMTRAWSIVQSTENDHIWIISVEVSWLDQEGQHKKVVLKSFRSI